MTALAALAAVVIGAELGVILAARNPLQTFAEGRHRSDRRALRSRPGEHR